MVKGGRNKMILRSMLYAPGNNQKVITKAATLPIDSVILDLEDAVPLPDKETARILVRDSITLYRECSSYVFVRVNSMVTSLTKEDLKIVVVQGLHGVMLAKTEDSSEVCALDEMLTEAEKKRGMEVGLIRIVPLIESAKGVIKSYEITSASSRIEGLAFGAGDYYRDLGGDVGALSYEETELLYARSQIVNTSKAAGIQAIDTPYLGLLQDRDRFLNQIKIAKQLGFSGKQCIHPTQIDPVNDAFSPSENEVAYASRLVEAFKEAEAKGMGAISFEGKMIDRMSYLKAKELLDRKKAITEREKNRA